MYVCHCAVVTDREVVTSIGGGARTLAQVCRATRAGQSCGRCVETLRELLCQHCPITAPLVEEVVGAAV